MSTRKINGKTYEIYDAFPSKDMANDAAKHMRTEAGSIYSGRLTLARVIDLGETAGRLRHAIYVAGGKKL